MPGSTSSTSIGSGDAVEAILEAVFAELPLAAVCAFIVYDAERFLRYSRELARLALLEQAQPMLELRDAKLELVDLVAKDEIELCRERASAR